MSMLGCPNCDCDFLERIRRTQADKEAARTRVSRAIERAMMLRRGYYDGKYLEIEADNLRTFIETEIGLKDLKELSSLATYVIARPIRPELRVSYQFPDEIEIRSVSTQ